MFRLRHAWAASWLALAPGAALAQAAAPAALVISNSAYGSLPRLPGCEISANLAAATLSRAGFKVTRQSNPSNARLGTAIATLGDEMAAQPNSRALIYLCGYVSGFSERLFLLPAEARLERPADVLSQGIVARLLMSSVAGPASAAGLVLMDVATLPDQQGPLPFESMLRAGDAAHAGMAAAGIAPSDGQGPAPLAAALADMLADNRLDVAAELNALPSRPGIGRALLFNRAPTQTSWLLGEAPPPAAPPAAAAPVPAAPPAAAAAVPDAPATLNPAERRRVQLALRQLGYFRGQVNGTFGADSLAAIRRFQTESGAEATGRLTVRQVEQILP